MKNSSLLKQSFLAGLVFVVASGWMAKATEGQSTPAQARIVEAVQNEKVVTLRGNVHPMARTANDRGTLHDQQSVTRMQLLLQRRRRRRQPCRS